MEQGEKRVIHPFFCKGNGVVCFDNQYCCLFWLMLYLGRLWDFSQTRTGNDNRNEQ